MGLFFALAFCFWGFWAEIGLESREEGLTGLLVGVGKPQLIREG
jgi:hypothetical protein